MATATKPSGESAELQAALRGRFVWYDLMTTDVAAATDFYAKVAGWGTQEFDMGPAGTYRMWTVENEPIGGVVDMAGKTPPGTPPHWLAYVSVPNVDETVIQAESLGGKVLAPAADIPTVGRYAVLADPQGAAIAIYTSLSPAPAPDGKPKVGHFSWHELMTTDVDAAFAFYSQLFGWEKTSEMDMGEMGIYLMYGQRGIPYGGMMAKSSQMPTSWGYYFRVPSADTAAETVKSLGGQVINGPMEVPGGDRIANCLDPQGAYVSVHSTANG